MLTIAHALLAEAEQQWWLDPNWRGIHDSKRTGLFGATCDTLLLQVCVFYCIFCAGKA
jgi:hypothetical protein